MTEEPAYLQTVSLHVERVLDEIGLNEETIKARRQTYLFQEHTWTTHMRLNGNDLSVYHFGSQTEGATTPGLESDLDTLYWHHDFNAMQDWQEWQPGKVNLLMLHEDTAHGFCRLQRLRPDIPMARENLVDTEHNEKDIKGRVILKNTLLIKPGDVRNGPAASRKGNPGFINYDIVAALKCGAWPRQAEEFISQHRRHNWPTQWVLQQAVTQGCFLVPVGRKLSPTEPLEWRISASQAERCLMFSLNIVHIKVYVLLKMLVKSFVEPRARDCISSYHCKTALFYCIESTDSGFWVRNNLLQCTTRCLALLLSWVAETFCPHFIISQENLFAGKITAQNRYTVQSILRDLIMTYSRVLLGVTIDDLGLKLQAQLSKAPSVIPVFDSEVTVMLIGCFELKRRHATTLFVCDLLKRTNNTKPITVIRSVYTHIDMLNDGIRQLNKPKRQATNASIKCLYGWLWSMLASIALSHKMRVPRIAIQLLRIGATYDVAVMLKLASVLYSDKDYRKVETLLQEVNTHISSNMIEPICGCYAKATKMSPEFYHMLYALRGRKARDKLFASCVVFSRHEIHCAPPALRNEFFRSVGDDRQHRDVIKDDWVDLAAVDCVPFLYFLQYVTYRQLGNHDIQKQLSLLNLTRCISADNNFRHLETACNLLGQCMEEEQKPELAMRCYMTLLEIRPRYNAANWHTAVLCYKVIQPHL